MSVRVWCMLECPVGGVGHELGCLCGRGSAKEFAFH